MEQQNEEQRIIIEEVDKHMNPASMDSLPDDILIHILSFLPMKKAASTSILSKRWRTLFALTHNLEFDDPFVFDNEWYYPDIFWNFVHRTMALKGGSHVKKFSLNVALLCGNRDKRVDQLIWYALKHGVSDMHLRDERFQRHFLPRLFTSTTLVKLSLGRSIIIHSLPSDTYLPSLKILLLDEIGFENGQVAKVFLTACPALEDLTLVYKYSDSYSLSSKTIKKLSFKNNESVMPLDFSFDMPNVVDLDYSDYHRSMSLQYCQFDLLVKAKLDLHYCPMNELGEYDVECVKNLLTRIRNVRTLHLTGLAVQMILICCKDELPVFNNLVDLVFRSDKKGLRVLLPRFLECSPNLKVLGLSDLYCCTFSKRRFMRIQIPLENKIKVLSVMEYEGHVHELRHIGHFLLNMKCLKVLKVYVSPITVDEPKKMQLTDDLMKLPRTSNELKIQVMRPLDD